MRFLQLPAGIYRLQPADSNQYVKSLRIEGREQADSWLDLRQKAPAHVEAVVAQKSGAIEGRLDLRDGETHALAITVLAVDETRSGAAVQHEIAVADHAGEFAFGPLAPGKWRVFAIEGFEDGPWGSQELAAALAGKSVAIDVGEGPVRGVSPRVISTEEWEAALRKVGM